MGKSCPVYSFRAGILVADMVTAGLSERAQSCHLWGSIELGTLRKFGEREGACVHKESAVSPANTLANWDSFRLPLLTRQ